MRTSTYTPALARACADAFVRATGDSAAIFGSIALAVLVLSYSDVAGVPVGGDASYTEQLLHYATDIPTGQAQAVYLPTAAPGEAAADVARLVSGRGGLGEFLQAER